MPHVLTVIQARSGSSRLRNKVLLPLGDSYVLFQMIERVQRAQLRGTVVVATTDRRSDDPLAALCADRGIECFRGHETDLLDRHYRAMQAYDADIVVKIPSDCPLIDPAVIDRVIGTFLNSREAVDYVSNLHPASYPDGNDVEVMSGRALQAAWNEAVAPHEREHTTAFFWDNPNRFCIKNVSMESGLNLSMTYRWVLDYYEDYLLIKEIFHRLHRENPNFGISDILNLLEQVPALREINRNLLGDSWMMRAAAQLKTYSEAPIEL